MGYRGRCAHGDPRLCQVNLPPTFAPLAAVGSIREKAGLDHLLLLSDEANLWPRYSIEVASTGCDPVPEGTL